MEIKRLYANSEECFPAVNMVLFAIIFISVMRIATYGMKKNIQFDVNKLLDCVALMVFAFWASVTLQLSSKYYFQENDRYKI